jgi:NADPH:quinone reductase-like Zn-dependent oxidoreductase
MGVTVSTRRGVMPFPTTNLTMNRAVLLMTTTTTATTLTRSKTTLTSIDEFVTVISGEGGINGSHKRQLQ